MENTNRRLLRLALASVGATSSAPAPGRPWKIAGRTRERRERARLPSAETLYVPRKPHTSGSLIEIPSEVWRQLEDLRRRFDAELRYVDSCLAGEPPKDRVAMIIANASELRRVAFLHRLIDKAYALRLENPRQGLQITDDLLDWTLDDESSIVGVLRARALMERGDSLRILGVRDGAFAAFAEAWFELEESGQGDPPDYARYLEGVGSLVSDCGRFREAARLLRQALARAREGHDPHTLQRILIAGAAAEICRGGLERAHELLDEAILAVEPDCLLIREAAIHKMLACQLGGQPHRAYEALLTIRERFGPSWLEGFPPSGRRRALWVEGTVLAALRLDEEAIAILKRARELYVRAAGGYEVCRISIEMALSYTLQERPAEARRELGFGLPFLTAERALDRYVRDAVLLLQGTLQARGRLEAEPIRLVASRLDGLHRTPLRTHRRPPFAGLRL